MTLYDHELSTSTLFRTLSHGHYGWMKTYTFNDPELGRINYVDSKRYLWILSVLFPLIPLVGMGLMSWSG